MLRTTFRPVSHRAPSLPAARRESTRTYRGHGPEVVLVGTGAEISCSGTELDKASLMFRGRRTTREFLGIASRMGIIAIQPDGQITETMRLTADGYEKVPAGEAPVVGSFKDSTAMHALHAKWATAIESRTGIRSFGPDADWDATPFRARAEKLRISTDFAGLIPAGWDHRLAAPNTKPFNRFNSAMSLGYEVMARALVTAGIDPRSDELATLFGSRYLGAAMGTGIGPLHDLEQLALITHGGKKRPGPFDLAHVLANTVLGYFAPRVNFGGSIETHIGACASSLSGIVNLYDKIRMGRLRAGIGGGYETAATPAAIYGFNTLKALITNEQLLADVRRKIDAGKLDRDTYGPLLDAAIAGGKLNLPWQLTRLASMPMDGGASGFVMGNGGGAHLFMTLDDALAHGFDIVASIAGTAPMVPDSKKHADDNIATLGDGIGIAFERAIDEARANYTDFNINALGALVAHGTSTPDSNRVEREEAQRVLSQFGRRSDRPLLITGDKEQGHRIGGNHLLLATYILQRGYVPPIRNFRTVPVDTESGATHDERFPLTRVVGPAGAGAGEPVRLGGRYVHVQGAGFGRENTGIILRGFSIDDLGLSREDRTAYETKRAERRRTAAAMLCDIDYGWRPYEK